MTLRAVLVKRTALERWPLRPRKPGIVLTRGGCTDLNRRALPLSPPYSTRQPLEVGFSTRVWPQLTGPGFRDE